MVDTTALVGTAKVGTARVGSLGDTPPSRLRVHGACWELVADQAAIDAAKDHVAERERVVRDDLALLAQEKADAAKQAAVDAAAEAATAADEALEAALGEMVEGKSNVFIQDVPPVASMQRQGVLWIDTTPVTLADGTTAPGHTPKTWDPATSAWVAVTDSVAVEAARAAAAAHEAAEAAADAAGAAMAEARYAPRIADRAPGPADGEGKPAGAGWWQYDPVSQLLVQGWRWSGAVWERLDMDPVMIPVISIGTGTVGDLTGDRVTVTGEFVARVAQILQLDVAQLTVTESAVINELVARAMAAATAEFQTAYIQNLRSNGAVIDEAVIGDLAANLITSGLFRTAAEGQRLEIDSNGLIMWGVDPDGNEYEMVRLGPSGENLLTIGQSTISEHAVAAPSGQFEQLSIAGQSVQELLDRLPRGIVARARSTSFGEWDGSGNENWRLQLNFYTFPGRSYRVTVSSHYVQTRSALPNTVTEYLRWTDLTDGVGVTSSSPQLAGLVHNIPRAGSYSVPGMVGLLDGSMVGSSEDGTRTQVVLSARSPAGQDIRFVAGEGYPLALFVEDIGPSLPWTGRSWVHVGTPSQGSSGGAAPEQGHQERYTKTWTPQGYGGDVSGSDIVQGTYGSYGNRSGSWTMPGDMRTALQGSTIEKLEIYLYATHWYWGSGGTASIRATDGSAFKAFVGTAHTSPNWPRNQGRWVTVPSSWYPYFQSGAWKGIGVHTTSTNLLYYGRFKADATRFRATYRK